MFHLCFSPCDRQYSAITLKALTCEVNNSDYLVTMAPVKGWDVLGSKWNSHFLKTLTRQIAKVGKLGQEISKIAVRVGSFPRVCSGQYQQKKGQGRKDSQWTSISFMDAQGLLMCTGSKNSPYGLKNFCITNCWKNTLNVPSMGTWPLKRNEGKLA